jgi:ribosomal protein S18 acetylase RimI-like enzyme
MKPSNNLQAARAGACRGPACGSGHAGHAARRGAPDASPRAAVQPVAHAKGVAPAQAKTAATNTRQTQAARTPFGAHAAPAQVRHTAARPQTQTRTQTQTQTQTRTAPTAQRQAAVAPARPTQASYRVLPPTPLAGGRQQIKVAVTGTRQVAGSVDLRPTGGGKAYISNLRVEHDFRRQGLANQLMSAAMSNARSQGFSAVRLEAHPSDNGITPQALVSMYSRMGFRNVGRSTRGNPLMERRL